MLGLIVIALLVPIATSAPSGIGRSADGGCLCHGERNAGTSIQVQGLPDSFESNKTYNFSIAISSENILPSDDGAMGGFRLQISDGEISFDANQGYIQQKDDGWTHTEIGNGFRAWNFSFISPEDNTSFVDFIVYGNAVNGNGASTGDEWNSVALRLPGILYDGDLLQTEDREFSPLDYTVGIVALLSLTYLLFATIRG